MQATIIELLQKQQDQIESISKMLMTSKAVLNLDDLCALTGLSKSTIYKKTMSAKIPHYKQSKLFFDRKEIEAWLKENPVKTREEIEQEATSYVTHIKKGVSK